MHVRRDEFTAVTDALKQHARDLAIQFQRIADIQADLDEIKRAWAKVKTSL